jgi:Tol biopolymer transport system component
MRLQHVRASVIREGIIRALIGVAALGLASCQGEGTAPVEEFGYDIVFEQRGESGALADLLVLDLGTGETRRLLSESVGGVHPSGSLDGTRVVFSRLDNEFNSEIFLVNRDGTGLVNISNHAETDVMPAISPAGGRVAFVTDRAGFQDIFVVNTDGTGLRRITMVDPSPAVTTEWWPAWSPNSQQIAYSSTIDGTPDIWTTTVDAPTVVRTRWTGTLDTDLHPTWSDDGDRIAFERRDANTGETDIVILTLSTQALQVIRLPGQQLTPSWSPDGSLIAFSSNHDDLTGDLEIYTMRADGTDVARRTDNGLNDLRPTWLARP